MAQLSGLPGVVPLTQLAQGDMLLASLPISEATGSSTPQGEGPAYQEGEEEEERGLRTASERWLGSSVHSAGAARARDIGQRDSRPGAADGRNGTKSSSPSTVVCSAELRMVAVDARGGEHVMRSWQLV
jgi:hypothetical protein